MIKVCKRYTINEDEAIESMNTSFLKILKHLNTIQDIEKFPAWVKQVSVRTSIDFYRAKRKYNEKNSFSIDTDYSTVEHTHFNMDFTESKMDSKDIYRLIQDLPDTTREVLNLFAIDGFSHKEVGEMMNLTEEASRWHLFKARKILTEKLTTLNYTIK